MYGCLHDFDLMNSMFGAAWRHSGDISLTAYGGELSDPSQSMPSSMNNGATPGGHIIVGFWDYMDGHRHGLLVQHGVLQSYAVPASTLLALRNIHPNHHFGPTHIDHPAQT